MGLCKCPKKEFTSLFCYKHRVNVCQHCMVSRHSDCVIRSYLKWLEDCSYDPNCSLCSRDLEEFECVRLVCLDVFHLQCLNKYMSDRSGSCADCPCCGEAVLPAENLVSPLAQTLRSKLSSVKSSHIDFESIPSLPPQSELSPQPTGVTTAINRNVYTSINVFPKSSKLSLENILGDRDADNKYAKSKYVQLAGKFLPRRFLSSLMHKRIRRPKFILALVIVCIIIFFTSFIIYDVNQSLNV